jgi:hypothetical protein
VCGVRATNVVMIFMMAFVGIVILPRMIEDRSTIRQTFPITIHHHHLRLIVIIVETLPKKECRVGNVFVINVDTSTVYVTPRVLKHLMLVIRVLIIILKMISIILFKTLMRKYHITMVIRSKIRQILKIVGDRLKIFIMSQINVTILMVLTNPHRLPILIMKFLKLNPWSRS